MEIVEVSDDNKKVTNFRFASKRRHWDNWIVEVWCDWISDSYLQLKNVQKSEIILLVYIQF